MKGMREMQLNAYLFEPLIKEDQSKDGGKGGGNEDQEVGMNVKSYIYILKRAQMLCYQMILREKIWKNCIMIMLVAAAACMGGILWIEIRRMQEIRSLDFIMILYGMLFLVIVEVNTIVIIRRIGVMRARRERIYSRTSNFQVSYHLPENFREDQELLMQEFVNELEDIATLDCKYKWLKK